MVRGRRLIAVCTAFALALFGAVAASPAHAHHHGAASHAAHAIALDPHLVDHGDNLDHHDADHRSQQDGCDDPIQAESGVHAHAFPQFAPVSTSVTPAPSAWTTVAPAPLAAGAVSRASAPPLRPPRVFL